jgi:hypothetical protein
MKSEPDPLILQTETMNFEEQYNSDIELLTEEMLGFLRKNEVPVEWLITLMQELYLCNSDQ